MATGVIVTGGNSPYYVSSGAIDTSDIVDGGGSMFVLSGGIADLTTVNIDLSLGNRGALYVEDGGTAIGTTINGGYQQVAIGGAASGTTINGGEQDVYGTASGTAIDSSGGEFSQQYVYGSAISTTINGGGEGVFGGPLVAEQYVESNGTASYTTVENGGIQVIVSGGAAIGTVLNEGGFLEVESGGLASGAVVSSGGRAQFESGAIADGGVVSSGGFITFTLTRAYGRWTPINSSNVVNGVTIQNGAFVTFLVDQGGSISDFVATGSVVNSGGIGYILGGDLYIESGGTATGTIVKDDAWEFVDSGGVASGTVVSSGGSEQVNSGGVGSGTVVSSGGSDAVVAGGVAVSTIVSSGGYEFVYSGGVVSGTVVGNGGYEYVASGGIVSGIVVGSGGQIELPWSPVSANILNGVTIQPGALFVTLDVYQGQVVTGFVCNAGSGLAVESGAATSGTIIDGGFELVYSGGVAIGTTVNGGGIQSISFSGQNLHGPFYGGVAIGTVINSGGTEKVNSSGVAISAIINSGGSADVNSGGVASGTVINVGGSENVNPGGIARGTIVNSGGTLSISPDGGIAIGTTIGSGGLGLVGGTASGTTIASGGLMEVGQGGAAINTTINPGGTLELFGAGTQVSVSGAPFDISVDGSLSGTLVDNGALIFDLSSTAPHSTAITVSLTGSGSFILEGDGTLAMSGGKAFTGDVTISGGTLELKKSVAVGSGPITFASQSSGSVETLQVDSSTMPTNIISGFAVGDRIDLAGVTFSSGGGAVLGAGNVLTVTEGGQTYMLDFDPAQNFANETFAVSADTSGGTDVFLVQAQSQAPQVLSSAYVVTSGQSVSNVTVVSGGDLILAGGSALDTVISSGGIETVSSGGADVSATVDDGGVQYVLSGGTASGSILNDPGIQIVSAGGTAVGVTISGGEQDVYGTATATTIDSGGLQIIESGGIGSATTVNGGGTLTVEADGIDSGATVFGGVESGTNYAVVSPGGIETVFGVASNTTVTSGGELFIESGGSTVSASIVSTLLFSNGDYADSLIIVESGGAAYDTIVSGTVFNPNAINSLGLPNGSLPNGGLIVSGGGVASNTIIGNLGLDAVWGGVDIDAAVNSGGELNIHSAGTASGATVNAGGRLSVFSGGTTLSASLVGSATSGGGGREVIFVGGSAFFTTLSASAQLIVSSGGVAFGTVVNSRTGSLNGGMTISSGGIASGTAVNSGGFEFVSFSGTESGGTVNSGGSLVVLSGGTTISSMLQGISGTTSGVETVSSGGTAIDTTIAFGGKLVVSSGGTAIDTTDSFGGRMPVFGAASDTTINSGGVENVSSGGLDIGGTINDGGTQTIFAGGSATGTILNDPGLQIVSSGGTASGVTLSGGEQDVYGTAINTIASSSGVQVIESGGTAIGTTINSGTQIISADGSAISTTVSGNDTGFMGAAGVGVQHVESGGIASGTILDSGGHQEIHAGGKAINTTVSSGGSQTADEQGGIAIGTTIDEGGVQVAAGPLGTTIGTTINSGGFEVVDGVASGTTINSGGWQLALPVSGGQGYVSGTTINGGGLQFAAGSATAVGTTISGGGLEFVGQGGTATDAIISNGGQLEVFGAGSQATVSGALFDISFIANALSSGGVISGVSVSNNALIVDMSLDGSLGGTALDNGELIFDLSSAAPAKTRFGASLTGSGALIVEGNGTLVMSGGDAFRGNVTISGGTLELSSATAIGSGPITFASQSSGSVETLQVDSSTMPTNIISGFAVGDRIDLLGVTFSSGGGAVLGAGNVVTVTEGGQTYSLDFDPAQNFVNEAFTVSADGSGGTDLFLVQVPQVLSSAYTVTSGQSVANLRVVSGGDLILAGGTALDTVISSGGIETVSSGSADVSATVDDGGVQYVLSGGTASGTILNDPGLQIVSSGGTTSGVTLSGGEQDVYGTAIGTVIDSGGLQVVSSGGTVIGTVVRSGGHEMVLPNGMAISTVVSNGGKEGVLADATASGTVVSSGGFEDINPGGIVRGVTIESGGVMLVDSAAGSALGGTDIDGTVNSGGQEYVDSGGVVVGTIVKSGGFIDLPVTSAYGAWSPVSATTIVDGATIQSGAIVSFEIYQAGSISGFIVLSGSVEVVRSGGAAFGTVVSDGGIEGVFGGVSSDTTVVSGGTLILSGGTALDTVISSGGIETISSGGVDISATINGGGTQTIFAGGSASNTIVYGGLQIIESGGIGSAATISSGGTEYVQSGGTAIDVSFAGTGGLLKLDQPSGLGGTISNWAIGDTIDFVSASITSAGVVGNTLTITEAGNQTFSYQLANRQLGTGVSLQSDGSNGTDLVLVNSILTVTTPVISGIAQEGQTLTASATAGEANDTVTYQWFSSADGYTHAIGTGATYVVQEGDEGNTIEVVATATNENGVTASATSTPTSVVVDAAPTVTTPLISGIAQEGQTLTASATTGQADNTVTYQWFSSADGYTHAIGSGATYVVQEDDEGNTIEVVATATNENGATASATSTPTATVVDAAPTLTAQTYDAAAAFEQGWTSQSNPNGVWSYGYSSNFTTPVTLYDQTSQGPLNGPNAQYWLSSSVDIGESPSAEFNDGPAYDDGNVNFLANQFVLVPGIGGEYSDLVFTAPTDGTYSIVSSFRGDQYGIGTVVGVVANGNVLFNSSVTAEGQTVPFDSDVNLKAGQTVVFSVGPGGGVQNTGLSVVITGPSVTSTPVISGTAQEGQTLTASVTAGQADNTVTYQWFSSADGYTHAIGSGATYVVQEGDEGNSIEVVATVTNDNGVTASATSTPTSMVVDAAPTVTTPLISGIAQEGQTLTASATTGQADNTVTYQWFSSADGYTHAIGTGATYVVHEGDEGNTIEVVATATNDNGVTASATSTPTATVVDAAPTLTTPVISGTAQEGQTLTASATAGEADDTVTYQWFSSADSYTHAIGTGATYVVQAGDEGNAIEVVATATNDNGVTVSATSTPTIVAPPPTVISIVASPSTGDKNTGAVITLTVTMSRNVTVTGTPALTLNDGGVATYQSGSGSNTLVFTYTVANAQNAAALAVTGNNLNGSTIAITDQSGQQADLSGADVTFAGLAIGATVSSITANPPSGDLGPGKTVTFTVTMSEAVTVSGATRPYLTLSDGGRATYTSGSGTNVLTFTYTVGALGSGQNVAALAVTGFNPNGATVYDSHIAADTADLSGVTAFAGGPQIDTAAPTVTAVAASGAGITNGNGDLNAGDTVTLTVSFSEAVTVAGGTPTLSLSGGGTATYAGGSGTNALTFTYTVAAGQNTTDLAVNSLVLHGATIKDGAGNNAVLSGAAVNPPGILQIDTRAPTISSIVTSGPGITNGAGDLNAGDTVTLTVNFSENVTVAGGTPTLTLNDGGIAHYASGSGTNALTFTYQVAPGQNTPDLTVTGLVLGTGATIADGAGNAAVLSGAVRNPAGILKIDTTAPTVTRVVSSPATGEVTTGHSIRITLDTSEAVTVSGTPTLLLNDGGTATYDPAHSTATALAFNYTVAAGQVTSDLVVSGIELPSSSAVSDLAGNAANLSGAGANLGLRINTTATGPAGPSGGSFSITGSTELELFGASTANVTFAPGDTGMLKLDSSPQFKGTVAGPAPGNELDLADIGFGATTTLGYTPNAGNTGGTLSVSDGNHSAAVALLGQYIAGNFVTGSDGHGGTLIAELPPIRPLLAQPHA